MRTASSHTSPGRASERRAALLSCVAHAVLALGLIWLGTRLQRDQPAPATRMSDIMSGAIEIEVASAAPVQPPVQPPVAASPAQPAVAPAVSSIEPAPESPRPARARASTAGPPVPTGPAAASPAVLSMRDSDGARAASERVAVADGRPWAAGPADLGIDISPAHAARLIAPEPGPPASSPLVLPGAPPAAPDVRDAWTPTGGGTYGLDNLAFTTHIARDGQVTMEDRPSFQLTPRMPRVVTTDDSDVVDNAPSASTAMLAMDVATFDVTDWLMRRAGMDPYSSRKARFLDQTRDARAVMRAQARSEDLRNAVAALPGLLDQVWRDPERTVAERRALLFRIWDECADTGDDELVNAGRMARVTVLAFIRRRLPADSAGAFTAAELESLNAARKSTQPFAPYP